MGVLLTGLGALWGWAVTAYLLWRAWPGVRADIGRLRGRLGRSGGGRYSARRRGSEGLL